MDPINPLYLSTFLDLGPDWSEQPKEFAIISAYATTGKNGLLNEISRQMNVYKNGWLRRGRG